MARPPRQLTPDLSARHLFGAKMRVFRDRNGMTLDSLAAVVHMSRSHLSRVECAEYMPPADLPPALDAAFGTDGIFQELYALARREIHPDQYRRRMELEARAQVIEEYSGHTVPGLAQTEDYAREIFRASDPRAPEEHVESLVSARLSRQKLLTANPAPELVMILDEAVLRRPVGGAGVMGEQFARLIELADTPTTSVQVLPFSHGAHALLGGSLTLLTLDDRTTVAYEESIGTGTLIEDLEEATARRRAYDRIRGHALPPRDSAAMIRSAREALSDEHHCLGRPA
ncbi:helix-turn-helix domain-containing protein [Streptomyces montanisoli]|uniref:Helix-turn-helix transcriptional regulator n=1 Tax=Streptomyces montanisoli TaxID=2798581 RepID=A0A940MA17_9ACTN|nr:helix-turn-helix transcriptional regulator [Streptomyces montanisoli]MBP0456641.1 helix-turn-helix transcriptional regulator [Streptomyces montanisoli]